jgi:hypothetical protein
MAEKKRALEKILEGSIVTLWIEPDIFQIVQVRMESLNLDIFKFLRFFVTIDEAVVDITMSDFDREVWLPSSLTMRARVQTFDEEHRLQFRAEYDEYGKFTVSSDIEFK